MTIIMPDTFSSWGQPQPVSADHRPQGPAGADQLPDQHQVPRVPPHARGYHRVSRLVNFFLFWAFNPSIKLPQNA